MSSNSGRGVGAALEAGPEARSTKGYRLIFSPLREKKY